MEEKKLFTSKELCETLNFSDSLLRKFLKDPNFPKIMVGANFRFIPDEVLDYLRINSNQTMAHKINFYSDKRIVKMRGNLGITSYGIYWDIMERLAENNNTLELDYEKLSSIVDFEFTLEVKKEYLKSIIENFDLFVIENNRFSSKDLIVIKNKK